MEKIIIKAAKNGGKICSYSSKKDIKNLIKYITGIKNSSEQVNCWGVRGLIKDIDTIVPMIGIVQKKLGKDKGRRIYHFIISFESDMKYQEIAYIAANAIADFVGKEYQLVFGVHEDTDNIHIHMAVNAVSYIDGKKWHKNKKEFVLWKKQMETIIYGIADEWGLA